MTPYYTEKHAKQMARILSKLLAKPEEPLVVNHEILGINKRTLQNRLYNSLRFLCEKLDPDGVWTELRSRLRFSVCYNGVKLELLPDVTEAVSPFKMGSSSDLIGRITEFLENPHLTAFEETNISIAPEIVESIQTLLTDLDVISIVRQDRVKIIKDTGKPL